MRLKDPQILVFTSLTKGNDNIHANSNIKIYKLSGFKKEKELHA